MSITVIALAVAVLMLMFLFVDATSNKRNEKVVRIELGIFVMAALVALVSYLLGGM